MEPSAFAISFCHHLPFCNKYFWKILMTFCCQLFTNICCSSLHCQYSLHENIKKQMSFLFLYSLSIATNMEANLWVIKCYSQESYFKIYDLKRAHQTQKNFQPWKSCARDFLWWPRRFWTMLMTRVWSILKNLVKRMQIF